MYYALKVAFIKFKSFYFKGYSFLKIFENTYF